MRDFNGELPGPITIPYTDSRPLPPYRGILAVDAKDFTGRPAIQHETVSRAVPDLLRTAMARAELRDLWDDRRFPASTGDGYVFGFDPVRLPFVIHPLLLVLQDVLTDYNILSHGAMPIRLRASLHLGPLPDYDTARRAEILGPLGAPAASGAPGSTPRTRCPSTGPR